ncbi:LysR family transcriptional regulator [Lactococcus raffinolactis]|uniref:LysR family transcriptional regulator n=1 Tax=Pseudolactococcus raffinolactis TaxID=1366 RepID=UPI0014368263|nr:LysR family transcriptional regulator [Lactococcus raffinolactis]QIW60595.1 LysR family transcriptional regulator [Lactococcus raffinolactis]
MEELYYFVQVATLLSFSQVAQSMGVSQPAVSQKIKSLEKKMGCQLFFRFGKRVMLTPEGKLFLAYAENAILAFNTISKTLTDKTIKQLTLAGDEHFLSILLKTLSDLDVQAIEITNSRQVIELIENDTYDIGVLWGNHSLPGLHRVELSSNRLVLAGSKRLINTYRTSGTLHLIRYDVAGAYKNFLENFIQTVGLTPTRVTTYNNLNLIKKAMLEEIGLAVISTDIIYDELHDGSLEICEFPETTLSIKNAMIYKQNHPQIDQITTLISKIKQSIKTKSQIVK